MKEKNKKNNFIFEKIKCLNDEILLYGILLIK